MQGYKNALCISGTHGKTTTTSMCTHIFLAAGRDPSVMIGGTLPILGCGHRVGRGDTIIAESCEYCNSFLSFAPTVAVILNVEADHLDYFKDLADVEKSFRAFADKVPENGLIMPTARTKNTMFTLRGEERDVMTFGAGSAREQPVWIVLTRRATTLTGKHWLGDPLQGDGHSPGQRRVPGPGGRREGVSG